MGYREANTCQDLQQHRRGKRVVAQKAEPPQNAQSFHDPNISCTHFVRECFHNAAQHTWL